MRNQTLILFTVLLVLAARGTSAQGIIVDRDWRLGHVVLEYSDIEVTIRDNVAHVSIDHEFRNTGASVAEGVFLFPLPEDASVADFKLDMNGRLVSGEVLPADEARTIYRKIVQKNLDPALLEWVDGRSFRASVFPIAPGESQRLVLEYDLVVERNANRLRFVHPLAGVLQTNTRVRPPVWRPRTFERRRLHDRDESQRGPAKHGELTLTVSIEADGATELRNIYSPSHDIDVDYHGDHSATVSLNALNDENGSFVLYYSLDADRISATLIPFRPYRDKPGYFMLMVAPPTRPSGKIQPREIVFVLDTSGSMAGEKIEQAKSALKYALKRLGPDDSFGLIAFSSDTDPFDDKLSSTDGVDDALYFVEQLAARGGTNINAALTEALEMLEDSKNGSIVFLTDGLPSSGVTDVDKIVSNVTEANRNEATLFSFGVGFDVNTRLLGDLSESTAAFAQYITPDENLEESVSTFYDRIRYPVLSDVEIEINSGGVFALAPRSLPDLFVGDPLILTGRYRNPGKTVAVLTGTVDGRPFTQRYDLDLPAVSRRESFVARLWATRRVGQLLTDVRRNGESKELKDEIIALATEFGIVTPYTSYLVQEDESPRMSYARRTGRSREEMAQAVPFSDTGRDAVAASKQLNRMQLASRSDDQVNLGIQAGDQNFVLEDGIWQSAFATERDSTNGKPAVEIQFASDAYFDLVQKYPETKQYLRLGNEVTFVFRNQLVQIGNTGQAKATEADFRMWFGS